MEAVLQLLSLATITILQNELKIKNCSHRIHKPFSSEVKQTWRVGSGDFISCFRVLITGVINY